MSDTIDVGGKKVYSGKPVTVDPKDSDDLLDKFADADGPVDLTTVTCAGAPGMFSQMRESGMPRDKMPQIPKENLGDFQAALAGRGTTFKPDRADPAQLKATQSELDGRNSGRMMRSMRNGQMDLEADPIWVSSDGHILDGHHRWAAAAAISADSGGITIPIIKVDMPMSELLPFAQQFNAAAGIASRGIGVTASAEFAEAAEVFGMVTDAADFEMFGMDITDLDGLPHGDGTLFAPTAATAAEALTIAGWTAFGGGNARDTARGRWTEALTRSALSGAEFKGGGGSKGNPWHDEKGKFGRKGVGGENIPNVDPGGLTGPAKSKPGRFGEDTIDSDDDITDLLNMITPKSLKKGTKKERKRLKRRRKAVAKAKGLEGEQRGYAFDAGVKWKKWRDADVSDRAFAKAWG
jgi:hypothetical protein